MARFNEDKIILEVNCKGYKRLNLSNDPKYKAIKEAEASGNLPETKGTISNRAAFYHKKGMLYEIVDYDDGSSETRIKENLIVAGPSDAKGRLFLNIDQVDLARSILKALRGVDKNVGVDPASALSEEEIMGPPPPPPHKGGRNNRKIVRIRPC